MTVREVQAESLHLKPSPPTEQSDRPRHLLADARRVFFFFLTNDKWGVGEEETEVGERASAHISFAGVHVRLVNTGDVKYGIRRWTASSVM